MYALAKHSPLVLRRIFIQLSKTSCSHARAVLAAGSHHMPRWLWGLLRQARPPQFRQHSEFTSVLAARAQGQENAGVGYKAGKSDTPAVWLPVLALDRDLLARNLNFPQCIHRKTMRFHLVLPFLCILTSGLAAVPTHAQKQDSNQTSGATIKIQTILVNEPVTVRDSKGQMVHNLELKNFRITDNGVEKTITHFELGGDAVSLVVLVETSSRIDALLPDLRKCGILLSQGVMGPNGEAGVVGFNDSVDKLQDFTSSADAIEKTFMH